MKPARILIYSGGLDSTTLLWHMVQDTEASLPVRCVTFDYGQRHRNEIDQARHIATEMLGIDWILADLGKISWLLDGEGSGVQINHSLPVPTGHYAEENMRQTVSPNRNMIMLSVAVGHAVATHSPSVSFAAHSGDHAIYPDCRPEFVHAMRHVVELGNYGPPLVLAPFIHHTKADIVKLGNMIGVPFGKTVSCYQGWDRACGRCGTCVERLEAFHLAGIEDPIDYVDREFWKKATEKKS